MDKQLDMVEINRIYDMLNSFDSDLQDLAMTLMDEAFQEFQPWRYSQKKEDKVSSMRGWLAYKALELGKRDGTSILQRYTYNNE